MHLRTTFFLVSKLFHSPQILSKVIEIFLHQHTKIERVHKFTGHLVCKLLTIFLIASKALLISLPYVIFHTLELFVLLLFFVILLPVLYH